MNNQSWMPPIFWEALLELNIREACRSLGIQRSELKMANQFGANVTGTNVSEGRSDESVSGVQLDAPMSGGYEDGFSAVNGDMSDMASPAPYIEGVEMPGVPMGITGADIMQGMATGDTMPQGVGIGTTSDSGSMSMDGIASSAGFHMVTVDFGGNGFEDSGVPDTGIASYDPSGNQQAQ